MGATRKRMPESNLATPYRVANSQNCLGRDGLEKLTQMRVTLARFCEPIAFSPTILCFLRFLDSLIGSPSGFNPATNCLAIKDTWLATLYA
jgi:hypothetical protein